MVKRVDFGNDVLPPTAAGQIPVASQNAGGQLVYEPVAATLPTPTAADVGKVLAIDTVTGTGVTYKYEALTPIDPLVLSIYNQNGVLLPTTITNSLNFTFMGKTLTLAGTGNIAVFYNATTQVRTTTPIAAVATTIVTTGDATYVFMNPDGTIGQVHTDTDPADFKTANYLCKVYHPGGGDIVSVKAIYTILSHPQENLRDYSYGLGIMAQGFSLALNTASTTGTILQNSPYAVVSGYNINPTDNMPSQRIFPVVGANGITFQYWSWNVGSRQAAKNTVIGSYGLDNPANGSVTAIPSGQVGIVSMFAGSDGSYIFVAPQYNAYGSFADAVADALNYVGRLILPQLILEQYDLIGVLLVSGNVTAPVVSSSSILMLNSISPGGAPADDLLPAPSTAGVVKVLAGANAYSIQPDTPTPAVDLTGFVNGDILGIAGGKIAPVKPDAIFPTGYYKDALKGYFGVIGNTVTHMGQNLVNSGITITVSGVPGGGQQAVFSGVPTFCVISALYENAQGQVFGGVYTSSQGQLYFDTILFSPLLPRTFSDNTQGLDFQIEYYIL